MISSSKYLIKSGMLKNVLTLMTGTLFAQLLSIAVSPILSRLYLPIEFGPFAIYSSVLGVTTIFATLRYELAIVVAKSNEDALNLFTLSCLISLLAGGCLVIAAVFINDQALSFLKLNRIKDFLFIIALITCFSGIYQSLNYWFNRVNQYHDISYSKIGESVINASVSVGMGLGGFGSIGLVLGQVFGKTVSTGMLGAAFWRKEKHKLSAIQIYKLKSQALQHINFPRYDLANALFYMLRMFVVVSVLGYYYGMSIVGLYAFAEKILAIPVGFLSNSVSQVFYRKLSTTYLHERHNSPILIKKTLAALFLVTTIPFVLIVLTSKYYIPFVFGKNWYDLYFYLYALSPVVYLRLLLSPVAFSLKVIGKQHISLILNFFAFIAISLSISLSYFIGLQGYQAIILVSFVTFLVTCLSAIVIFKLLDVSLELPYYIIFTVCVIVYFAMGISEYGN